MVQLIRAEDWLDHTDRAIGKVVLIEKVMIDAETGIRGILISDRRALAPYEAAVAAFPNLIRDTQALVEDNSAQQNRLRRVANYFSEWSGVAAVTVHDPNLRDGKAYFALGRGSLIPRAIVGGAAVSLMLRLLLNLMLRWMRA